MTTRAVRHLKAALRKTGLSPEEFAVQYPHAVAYYSGRSVRRWLKGGDIPYPVQLAVGEFVVRTRNAEVAK